MGWMERLPDTTELQNVVMPGSHDAGMWACEGVGRDGHVITQDLDMTGQLDAGCRFFDFRIFNFNTFGTTTAANLNFGHFAELTGRGNSAIGRFGPKLVPVLKQVAAWMANNNDTVFLRFSHINSSNNPVVRATVATELGAYLYKPTVGPLNLAKTRLGTLGGAGALRKKVCTIYDAGDKFVRDWPNGVLPYKSYKKVDTIPAQAATLDLQMCGEYSDKSNYEEMVAGQVSRSKDHVAHCLAMDPAHLFMMYFTLTSGVQNIKSMTSPHFGKLPAFLAKFVTKRALGGGPNIVAMDFIDQAKCDLVVNAGNTLT
jgi:hypothetical protein